MPQISIITPLYNKAAYIQETIRSVLAQTLTDWELLIVDNGSTDGSWQAAQQLQDPRIQLLTCPRRGPGAARNYGLQQAQGEWIQFLDADDLLAPEHLAQQLATAHRHPAAVLIAASWQEFFDGQPAAGVVKHPAGRGREPQALQDAAIAFAPWADHAAIIQRRALTPPYQWPEELDQYLGEDIAFWFKLVTQYPVAYGDSIGALYRLQTPQCRNQNRDPEKWLTGIHAALCHNQNYWLAQGHAFTPGQCEHLMRVFANAYLLAREQQAVAVAERSLALANQWLQDYLRLSPAPKLSLRLRHLIGLKRFLHWFERA